MEDLRSANLEKLVKEIDCFLVAMEKTVRDSPFPLEDKDASWSVRISEDRLKTYLELYPAVGGGASLDPEEVFVSLEGQHILNIHRDRVFEAVEKCNGGKAVEGEEALVAYGVPPVPPEQGFVEFLVPIEKTKRTEETDGDPIDWKNLWTLPSVMEGTVIARVHPPLTGSFGTDVFGQPIPCAPPAQFRIKYGDGVTVTDEAGIVKVVAARNVGQPVYRDDLLDVLPILFVQEDVDLASGDIDFIGSVVVKGSVTDGFSVRAGRDITVQGSVYNARISAGGSFIVKGGIVGENTEIRTGGDIRAGYVEYGKLISGVNIEVFGYTLFATMEARKSVFVQGRNRRGIIGGTCVAGQLIETLCAGSPMESQTILEVGKDPVRVRTVNELLARMEELEGMQRKVEGAIQSIKGPSEHFDLEVLSEDAKGKLFLLARYHKTMGNTLKALASRIDDEKRSMINDRKGSPRIKIRDRAYPNVSVKIWESTYILQSQEMFVSFFVDKESQKITKGVF